MARQQTNLRTGVKRAVLRDDAAFFERDVLREDRDAAAASRAPAPPAVVAPPAPAPAPRRPPAPSSPPTGPPPQRQWDEARPWVAADEALADIAEAASIVDASTSGQSLDPRALASVPWAHQIIELRTLIGAKGMETLSAGRERRAALRCDVGEAAHATRGDRPSAARSRGRSAGGAGRAPAPPRVSAGRRNCNDAGICNEAGRRRAPPAEPLRLHARITALSFEEARHRTQEGATAGAAGDDDDLTRALAASRASRLPRSDTGKISRGRSRRRVTLRLPRSGAGRSAPPPTTRSSTPVTSTSARRPSRLAM